jgi:hypothetical protein
MYYVHELKLYTFYMFLSFQSSVLLSDSDTLIVFLEIFFGIIQQIIRENGYCSFIRGQTKHILHVHH